MLLQIPISRRSCGSTSCATPPCVGCWPGQAHPALRSFCAGLPCAAAWSCVCGVCLLPLRRLADTVRVSSPHGGHAAHVRRRKACWKPGTFPR
eukprot:scaffold7_cov414-Pavlova_lutheri.AAC.12